MPFYHLSRLNRSEEVRTDAVFWQDENLFAEEQALIKSETMRAMNTTAKKTKKGQNTELAE